MSTRIKILMDVMMGDMALNDDELRALRDALNDRLRHAPMHGKRTLFMPGEPLPCLDGDDDASW